MTTTLATLLLAALSFAFCMVLTPICRDCFEKRDLVDQPDTIRKFHGRAVPRVGGIAVFASILLALGTSYLLGSRGVRLSVQHHDLLWGLLPGAAIVFATGLIDDLIGLKPHWKLLGELCGAAATVSFGVVLRFHGPFWLQLALSVLWLLACTNALNLIDGIDGLATGIGLTAAVTSLAVGVLSGNQGLIFATAALAGALLGFLRYNFSPASIFLGDSGSLTIGFLLGSLGLIWSGGHGMIGMIGPVMTLSLPLIDVALAIARRYLRNVPLSEGDRSHVHHRMLALGFSTRRVALMLYAFCLMSSVLALVIHFGQRYAIYVALPMFAFVVVIGVRRLQYIEFVAARCSVTRLARLRSYLSKEILLAEMHTSLSQAGSVDDCWQTLKTTCGELDIASARMVCFGLTYEHTFRKPGDNLSCSIDFSLGEHGHICVTGANDAVRGATLHALLNMQRAIYARLMLIHQSVGIRQVA